MTTCRPASGPAGNSRDSVAACAASAFSIASTIAGGSAIRPGPNSPQAIGPEFGADEQDAVGA